VIAENQGGASLMDRMGQEQVDREGKVAAEPMPFEPAPGMSEDEGIQAINDLLNYDVSEPVTALVNEPRLYVLRRCRNFIWCMQNYTGRDGKTAASKDPVDLARYMATAKLEYYEPGAVVGTGGMGE